MDGAEPTGALDGPGREVHPHAHPCTPCAPTRPMHPMHPMCPWTSIFVPHMPEVLSVPRAVVFVDIKWQTCATASSLTLMRSRSLPTLCLQHIFRSLPFSKRCRSITHVMLPAASHDQVPAQASRATPSSQLLGRNSPPSFSKGKPGLSETTMRRKPI